MKATHSQARLIAAGRDPDVALEDAFRGYRDKASTHEKVRVISEDFIDDIIAKRAKMGLGPPPDHFNRELQSSMIK